ncbi:MAG: DegV family protein [Brotaphodocola sp.]
MKTIVIVAETGSDIPPEMAAEYGIRIAPMHVTFGEETFDDGAFPAEKICDYYKNGGKLPKTSGCVPEDFKKLFDEIHGENPDAQILYLAYSAVTTCSYQSAAIAAEGRDYVTFFDTQQVSAGQCMILVKMAEFLKAHPEVTMEEALHEAEVLREHARMCFVPDNLEFLRAGGRVSNAAYMGARILNLHPCIELLDGKLIATKKYRGKMVKIASQMVREYSEKYDLKRDCLWFIWVVGMGDDVRRAAEEAARACGFRETRWIQARGVITTHGGPGAIGLAGFCL